MHDRQVKQVLVQVKGGNTGGPPCRPRLLIRGLSHGGCGINLFRDQGAAGYAGPALVPRSARALLPPAGVTGTLALPTRRALPSGIPLLGRSMAPVLAQRLAAHVAFLAGLGIHDDLLVHVPIAIDEPPLLHPPSSAVLQLVARL